MIPGIVCFLGCEGESEEEVEQCGAVDGSISLASAVSNGERTGGCLKGACEINQPDGDSEYEEDGVVSDEVEKTRGSTHSIAEIDKGREHYAPEETEAGESSDADWCPRRLRRKGIPRKRKSPVLSVEPVTAKQKRGRGRPPGSRDRKPRIRHSEHKQQSIIRHRTVGKAEKVAAPSVDSKEWSLTNMTYTCLHCPFSTKYIVSIRKHVKRKHQDRPYACDFCPKNFAYKSDLRKHIVTHPQYKGRGGIKCPHCDRICVCKSHLQRHILIHTGENRTFACPKSSCNKLFTSKYAVDIHLEIHDGRRKRPFLCSTCGKSFTTKNVLLEHENIHSNSRPMKCEVCDKGFNSSSSLRVHRMTHSTECR